MKILVVEDDRLNMKLYCDVLSMNGFEPIKSRNGLDAVALAEQHAPAAILMDMRLPYKNGLEITSDLKSSVLAADIPVIALTGFAAPEHRDLCLKGGCDAYISKPVSIWDLVTSISRIVGRPEPRWKLHNKQTIPPAPPAPELSTPDNLQAF